MKTLKIYAEKISNGKVIDRKEIGVARFDNVMSARKYNSLKRVALNSMTANGGEYIKIVDELGRKDTFGGYPAQYPVHFE